MAKPSNHDVMSGGHNIKNDIRDSSKRSPGMRMMLHGIPIIWTPVAHLCETFSTQQRSACADQEMDWVRCASRVGHHRATNLGECRQYYEDYEECFRRDKSVARYNTIQRERKKQQLEPIKQPPHDVIRFQHDITD